MLYNIEWWALLSCGFSNSNINIVFNQSISDLVDKYSTFFLCPLIFFLDFVFEQCIRIYNFSGISWCLLFLHLPYIQLLQLILMPSPLFFLSLDPSSNLNLLCSINICSSSWKGALENINMIFASFTWFIEPSNWRLSVPLHNLASFSRYSTFTHLVTSPLDMATTWAFNCSSSLGSFSSQNLNIFVEALR